VASNTTLNSGTGGDVIATKERTHDGDASKVQVVTVAGVTGTEGAYTFADIASGAGAESAALRVTLATESLAALESLTTVSTVTTVSAVTAITNALPAGTNNIGDVDVLSVVPGTGATALGKAVDSAAGATDTGVAALFVRDDSLSALTPAEGDYVYGRVDANGAIHVRITAGGIAGKAEDAAHTDGDEGVVILGVRRDTAAVGSGTDGDYSTLNVDASGRLWSIAAQSGTWTVQPGNTANTTAWLVSPRPATAGGLTIFRSLDLDETEEEIKATAGQLYGYYFANTNAAARYLKFYNATAANVTVGTTTPVLTFYLPATSAGHVEFSQGIAFSTAITAAATTGVADNDTGAPSANDVILNAFYA
jgi:hypothetical protein